MHIRKKAVGCRERTMENHRDLAEVRSNLYGLLSSVYIYIPDEKTFSINWESAANLLGYPHEGTGEPLKEIEKGLKSVRDSVSKDEIPLSKSIISLQKDWTRLLRGVDKEGPLPPYESVYRTGRLQEKPAQKVYRLFSRMGIHVPDQWRQPLDYIGVELDFMRLLCQKEQEPLEKRRSDLVHEIVNVENSFLENHLCLWIFNFCGEMVKHAHEDFYRGIARLTMGLVKYDRIWTSHLLRMTHSGRGER